MFLLLLKSILYQHNLREINTESSLGYHQLQTVSLNHKTDHGYLHKLQKILHNIVKKENLSKWHYTCYIGLWYFSSDFHSTLNIFFLNSLTLKFFLITNKTKICSKSAITRLEQCEQQQGLNHVRNLLKINKDSTFDHLY